jgi:hypothetical protein
MRLSTTARPAAHRSETRQSTRVGFTEGAMILIALYALVGAGIGAACGSLLLGTVSGLAVGSFAAAAILLIRGAALGAQSA